MEWVVTLTGDEIDLSELSKVCITPDLTIEKDSSAFVLKSSYFASLTSDKEVREKGNKLLIPLNAGIKMELGAIKPIEIFDVMQINPDGINNSHVMFEATIRMRPLACELSTADCKNDISNPADPVISLSNLAESDSQVAQVCQYINLDFHDGRNLYKIYEVIRKDGFAPLKHKGKYEKTAELFRRTVNNPSSSGIKSRHAIDENPPENPLTLSDAQSFIKMLIHEWLDEKRKKKEKYS
jgi:hypothetical protein